MNQAQAAFTSVDEAQHWILRSISDCGELVRPRDMLTRELVGVGFSISNPRRRCVASTVRRFSLPLALGEFAWHMNGSDELSGLSYYAKRWADFSEDGKRITASCYGRRIFGREGRARSQWDGVVEILKTDPDSRRAVLSLWDSNGASLSSVDVPCTCTIQFLVRRGQLHAVVFMRSNDSIWGLPYDVFLFTMLQEYLAAILGVELGGYTHFVGSLHIYERHFSLAERILAAPVASFEMPPMANIDAVSSFLDAEQFIRTSRSDQDQRAAIDSLPTYWGELAEVLSWFRARRDAPSRPEPPPHNRYSEVLSNLGSGSAAASLAVARG